MANLLNGLKPTFKAAKQTGSTTGAAPGGITPASSPDNLSARFELAAKAAHVITEEHGKVEELLWPTDRLVMNPNNPREFYTEAKIAARAASLQADGQLYPILCAPYPGDESKLYVVDGGYRVHAANRLRWLEIRVRIDTTIDTPQKLFSAAYASNVEREGQSPFDDAFSWKRQINEGVFPSIRELAKSIGKKEDSVRKLVNIADIPRNTAEFLAEAQAPYRLAYEVYLFYEACRNTDDTDRFAKECVAKELSVREATALRKRLLGEHSRERRVATVSSFRYGAGGVSVPVEFKSFGDGGLSINFKELPPDHIEEVKALVIESLKMKKS